MALESNSKDQPPSPNNDSSAGKVGSTSATIQWFWKRFALVLSLMFGALAAGDSFLWEWPRFRSGMDRVRSEQREVEALREETYILRDEIIAFDEKAKQKARGSGDNCFDLMPFLDRQTELNTKLATSEK